MTVTYPDLTLPLPDSTTGRQVLSRALARLPSDLRTLDPGDLSRPEARSALATVQSFVSRAVASPRDAFAGAFLAALRRPTVGALARCLRDDLRTKARDPRTELFAIELATTIAVELALGGVLDDVVSIRTPPTRVLWLGARQRLPIPSGTALLHIHRGGVGIEAGSRRVERSWEEALAPGNYASVTDTLVLATEDNNPFAIFGLSSEDPPNAVDLGEQTIDAWVASLRACLELTREHLPEIRRDIDLHVQQFVPIGHDAEIHRSASYRQALGTIYLSLHPSLMTMTEAVIHEAQHNKLHALLENDPLLTNGPSERFSSPLRRDLRPLLGLLLAVHAFLPVERLYESMIAHGHPLSPRPSFLQRLQQVRAVNCDAATALFAHARPTVAGAALLDEIRREIGSEG